MTKLYFASQNKNKLKEVSFIFKEKLPAITILGVSDLGSKDQDKFTPEETGNTFLENACIKAHCLAKIIPNKSVFAEDSGLVVPALDGAPGIFSSRYAQNDKKRIERLLTEAKDIQDEHRKAYFFTSICLIQNLDKISFQGKAWGEISHEPSGTEGFGYDPIFYIPSLKRSFAELTFEDKQKYSHRRKALERLVQFITNNNQEC